MSILITGAHGMLASDLQQVLAGHTVTALSRDELDVTNQAAVDSAVAGHSTVINCAAYTRVDDAESHEDAAFAVNATGAGNLARAASQHGARLVQVSTDYVFDGSATSPYPESTPRNPVSAYGRTKAEGERLALEAHPEGTLIVRTAWLYGAGGPNFVKTMLRLSTTHDTLRVVSDQLGQPTWTLDLARQIAGMIQSEVPAGIYHATSTGHTSWFDFAREIFRLSDLDPERVTPIASEEYPLPAPRPAYSVLGHEAWARVGMSPLRDWRDALADALAHDVVRVP